MNQRIILAWPKRIVPVLTVFCVVLLVLSISWRAQGLQVAETDNRPISKLNYPHWKNITPVVNHNSRIYHTWTNGNESFYYRGQTAALNDFLRDFARLDEDVREVFLCKAKGLETLDQDQIPFDWELHLRTGLARRHGTLRQNRPTVTIYLGSDNIDAEKIKYPPGLTVIDTFTLAGQCFGTKGTPIAGANVSIYEINYSESSMALQARTTTDAHGRFCFSQVKGFPEDDHYNWGLLVRAQIDTHSTAVLLDNAPNYSTLRLGFK